ncbi:MAG: heavy metal translocating P-type ATPase metal-binding domain-containing protein [Deltaproteobacteria bacterium]|nr:heavy metal translocating P-type ATPase metal-binding domain-containing protein [Deltaproteobacteria bacterium]
MPVAAGRTAAADDSVDVEPQPAFCCAGCEAVYRFLHQEGLSTYYRLRDKPAPTATNAALASTSTSTSASKPVSPSVEGSDAGAESAALPSATNSDRTFGEMDDPVFHAHHVSVRADGSGSTELYLEGVHCAACVWLVERALEGEPGLHEARLDYGRARLKLVFDPKVARLSKVARRLASMGYLAHAVGVGRGSRGSSEQRALMVRAGVAAASAGNVMLMAFALYGGWLEGMAPEYWHLFRWASLAVSLPAVTYAAMPFYRGAWAGLMHRTLHMDLPISLGILAGFLSGFVNTVRGVGEVYFDSVTALVFLLLVGRILQLGQQRRVRESAELLGQLVPTAAHRVETGGTRSVPLEALSPGDLVQVAVDERIPSDGVVESGHSSVDTSLLTGESLPVVVGPEDVVFGGTVNREQPLRVRVTHAIRDARVARIAQMVAEAEQSRMPVVQLADRVARVFVAAVLVAAFATFAYWSWTASVDVGLAHGVALLVVSCPCALALATPLALAAAIGKAARRGMLVRSGAALETLGTLRGGRVFFDKTGTLTEGRMKVVRWSSDEDVGPFVVAVEAGTRHPVGRALVEFLRPRVDEQGADVTEAVEAVDGVGAREAVDAADVGDVAKPAHRRAVTVTVTVTVTAGGGVEGVVRGHSVVVGSPTFVEGRALVEAFRLDEADAWSRMGWTPVWVAVDGRVVGAAALDDALRSDARASVASLQRHGFVVEILSGDHPRVVERVGAELGLSTASCHGAKTPEAKREYVERALREHPQAVVMVGDGINDAGALAASTVGIAVTGGAESCLRAADVFVQGDGVARVLDLVEGARRTVSVIRTNVIFSLVYNAFGATLAILGHLSPLVAAILMPLSSIFVCTNAYVFAFGSTPTPTAATTSEFMKRSMPEFDESATKREV